MHELSICGAIADVVTKHAGGRRVETVHLRIGRLRQVVPDTLAYCWGLMSADTDLDGSVLDVEDVPVRVACHECGETSEVEDLPLFVCRRCDAVDVSVVAGEEFLVTALDFAEV